VAGSVSNVRPSGADEIRRNFTTQQLGYSSGQLGAISAVAAHDRAVGEGDLDRRSWRVRTGRSDEPRAAVQEGTEAFGPLRADQSAGLDVQETVCAVAKKTARAELDFIRLFAPHRFHGIVPEPAYRLACHLMILSLV